MSLDIVFTGFTDAARRLYTDKISSLIKEGCESILIVPEQYTLSAEKEMAKVLPPNAPLTFEVTNFTRLADKLFRSLGGLASRHADRARRALLLWDALAELSPALRATNASGDSINAGLVNRTLAAIREMEGFGIGSERLSMTEEKIRDKNTRLADKLSDLSLIMSMYKEKLAEKYKELGNELELAYGKLESAPDFMRGTNVFIEGFTSFTEPQYRLISLLAERTRLSVSLNTTKAQLTSFEFTELRSVRGKLIKYANLSGTEIKEYDAEGAYDENDAVAALTASLWHSSEEFKSESYPSGQFPIIYEADTPYEECRFVAESIKGKVTEGAKYSDFAIIARNAERYIGTLDDALMKREIPHFISKTRDIFSFEAVKLIFSALEIADKSFTREDVISYLKCGFSGVSREACDEFELYTDTWQISAERILDGEVWEMSPDGYGNRRRADSADILISVNETKRKLADSLLPFKRAINSAVTVRDHATALIGFAERSMLDDKIAARSEELFKLGEREAAEECTAIWKIICDSLDTLVDAAGDIESNLESFKNRFELVLGEAKIGRLPSYRDVVTVGSADILRIPKKPYIYILGANKGEFPSIPSERGYFADAERREMESLGLEMEGGTEFDYAKELFYFSRALSSSSNYIGVFSTRVDFSFKAASPSEGALRIMKLTGQETAIKISELRLEEKIFSLESAVEAAIKYDIPGLSDTLTELGYEKSLGSVSAEIKNKELALSTEAAEHIYSGDLYLSQTKIDKFIDCPFAYFCEYKLKLKATEEAQFDARNIGSFVHSILESFFREASEKENGAHALSNEEKRDIAGRAAEAYLSSLGADIKKNRRVSFALERLKSSALPVIDELCDELSSCKFKPSFFELAMEFDKSGAPRASKIALDDGTTVKIPGSIDRVDTYLSDGDVYVRVIDYKTGAKSFSPSDLDEGRNLQMFLYLKSIVDTSDRAFLELLGVKEGGRIIPAGVIYIKTNFSDARISHSDEASAIEAVKSEQSREGMLLDDSVSLEAMNPEYIPVRFKKDGTPYASSEKLLYTHAGWERISEKLEETVKRVGEAIKRGNVSATPKITKKKSPCEYCNYKAVCRKAEV